MKLGKLVKNTFLPPAGMVMNSNKKFYFRIEQDGDKFIPILIQQGVNYFIYDRPNKKISSNFLSEYKIGCYKKADAIKLCWDYFETYRVDNIYNNGEYQLEPAKNNET